MDVSVIIVNYNTCQMTLECIESVFDKTSGIDFEVILVDNASTDGSKEYFGKDNRIKYIYSDENLGFGGANNLGYELSQGKYIFLLNSDTLIVNNAIKDFFDYAEKSDSEDACFGTVLWDKNQKPIHSSANFPSFGFFLKKYLNIYFEKMGLDLIKDAYIRFPKEYPAKVDYITGADLFMKRKVIEHCGLFDPDFFMYYEETEMQFRYNKAGYNSILIDSPHIIHLCGKSNKYRRNLLPFTTSIKSGLLYYKKVSNKISYRVLKALSIIICIPYILIYPCPFSGKTKALKALFI